MKTLDIKLDSKKSKPSISFDKKDHHNLAKWFQLKAKKEVLDKELNAIEESLKNAGLEKWCQIYESSADNPGSILLEGNNGHEVMLTVKENTKLKPKEISVSYLIGKYGKIVETNSTVQFEPKLFLKYKREILKLIKSSTNITKEDKVLLIKESSTESLKSGLNNCLLELQENAKELTGKLPSLYEVVQDLGCTLTFIKQE